MRVYIDTNVYLDFLMARGLNQDRAQAVFFRSIDCEFRILMSEWSIKEILKYSTDNDVMELIEQLRAKIDIIEGFSITDFGVHKEDAIHLTLACKGNADVFLTSDKDLLSLKTEDLKMLSYELF
jgi:putative PIN family toxin of toxin-antitoxin system